MFYRRKHICDPPCCPGAISPVPATDDMTLDVGIRDGQLYTYDRILSDFYDRPENYGAVGDGVHDDTDAFIKCIKNSSAIWLDDKIYRVTSTLTFTKSITIVGHHSTISITSEINRIISVSNCDHFVIDGVEFSGHNSNCINVIYTSSVKNVHIDDCQFHDFYEKRKIAGVHCIRTDFCDRIYINKCVFSNIRCVYNNIIGDSAGDALGVYINNFIRQCVIINSEFSHIHSVDDSGEFVFEDSGAIHVTEANGINPFSLIDGCVGYNTGKRFLKFQTSCYNNVINCVYSVDTDDAFSCVSFYQNTTPGSKKSTGKIDNCKFTQNKRYIDNPNIAYVVDCDIPVTITNSSLDSGYHYVFKATSSDVTISACQLIGYGITITSSDNNHFTISGSSVKTDTLFYLNIVSKENSYIHFYDCELTETYQAHIGGINYGSVVQSGRDCDLIFKNCVIHGYAINLHTCGATFENCDIHYTRGKIITATDTSDNPIIFIDSILTSDVVRTGQYAELSNHPVIFIRLSRINDDSTTTVMTLDTQDLTIDQTSMIGISFVTCTISSINPMYHETISTSLTRYPDGYKYLNIDDGKLYVKDNGAFVAVN